MASKRAPVSIDEWRKAKDPELQKARTQALVDRLIPDAPGRDRWEQRVALRLICEVLPIFDLNILEALLEDRRRHERDRG